MAQEEELDLKGLFYKLANAEQEGEDAVMDRKKITRALKVTIENIGIMFPLSKFYEKSMILQKLIYIILINRHLESMKK